MRSETLHRLMSGVAIAVGIGAAVSPRRLARLYGMDSSQMTGVGALGWRLFAVRNLAIGVAAARGNGLARDATVAIQGPDQLVFWHAFVTRSVPRRTSSLAIVTSAIVAGTGLAARSLDER